MPGRGAALFAHQERVATPWRRTREEGPRAEVSHPHAEEPRSEGKVPEPRLVGDFGVTPGFDQRAHLEAVISHGAPPIKWVRRLVLGA